MSAPSSSPVPVRVAIVGLGAVGCHAAQRLRLTRPHLHLSLIDGDRVEQRNLGRQHLYEPSDIGMPKVDAAARKLKGSFTTIDAFLSAANAEALLKGHAFVADCTDDLFAKALIDDACARLAIPLVSGGAHGTQAQSTVMHVPGSGAKLGRTAMFSGRISEEQSGCDMSDVPFDVIAALGGHMADSILAFLHGHPLRNGQLDVYDSQIAAWSSFQIHASA